jgi:hypothetical protein
MNYTLYTGCSATNGNGMPLGKEDPDLWVNKLHQQCFSHTNKLNMAQGGRSCANIFQDTVKGLLSYPVDYAIVQWTSVPRYEMELGFELYSTWWMASPRLRRDQGVTTHEVEYSEKYLRSIGNRFGIMAHLCYEIQQIVEYVNSLVKLASLTNTKIFFVYAGWIWDQDFFTRLNNVTPDQYTPRTQEFLLVKTRSDEEIHQLYTKLHDRFEQAGGIHESKWLNLYEPMWHHRIDVNDDGFHPGVEANARFVEIFSKALNSKL